MTHIAGSVRLVGYSDRLSIRSGETIAFKVSSQVDAPCTARLMRSICADPNPAGTGIVETDMSAVFPEITFASRLQEFSPGSYARTDRDVSVPLESGVAVEVAVFPTLAKSQPQTILNIGALSLFIDGTGAVAVRLGEAVATTGAAIALRRWHRVAASYDPVRGLLSVSVAMVGGQGAAQRGECAVPGGMAELTGPVLIAARWQAGEATDYFNGKIEAPALHACASRAPDTLVARWDFARDTPSTTVRDIGGAGLDATLVNLPTRGVTGAEWDGSEMCWRHAPGHYAAIHFHDDDIYDFGWETDFSFTIPEDLPSGIYVMRIRCGDAEDAMPFFVCAPKGKPTAKLCVLVSTFTYTVYGNHARPDFVPEWTRRFEEWDAYPHNPAEHREYGLSTYNDHSDGSGICHASHLRPLFNLRPGYLTFGYGEGSGLRHFQADSHLISWLHAKGIDYDIVTDAELQAEGHAAIAGYDVVTTGTHPEYHTRETLDALQTYRDTGGNLLYLGGNGFYWRVALHSENEAIEIRRAEDGIRAWAAEPGEYYNAFDGTYGGLWRRSGRPPQALAGVGFSAQGNFNGAAYRRVCRDPAFDWLFEGTGGDVLGDFGFCGGGAAGFELDRADTRLGTPENAVVLASSFGHGEDFILVPEERLTHLTNLPGEPEDSLIRADMIWFDVPGGGSVFATGSITFCGSLPWNDFDNDVSRLLENVIRRHIP